MFFGWKTDSSCRKGGSAMAEQQHHQRIERPHHKRQYNEKAGDRLVVSQMTDARYVPYLQGLDTHMPEKVRHKEVSATDKPMRAVRQTNDAEQGKSLKKMDDIEMDTGNVEVGYETGKHRMHLALYRTNALSRSARSPKAPHPFAVWITAIDFTAMMSSFIKVPLTWNAIPEKRCRKSCVN